MNIIYKLCSRERFVLAYWEGSAFFSRVVAILVILFVVAKTPFLRSAVPEPIMLQSVITEGTAAVTPEFGTSGEFGTWTVRYIVGKNGIQRGGGIRIQLPDSWHAGPRNSANRLQCSQPEDEHFVTSTTSRKDISIQTTVESESKQALVKHAKISLDGRSERYVFVVRVRVTDGLLEKGDTISVVYGDRSHGSSGYRAAAVSTEPESILIAVDSDGDSRFRLLTPLPKIRSLPGEAVEMLFHAPSHAVQGHPEEFLISLLDKENNPVLRSETIRIQVLAGEMDIPKRVVLRTNRGYVRFTATPRAAGVIRLRAVTEELSLAATSNPMLVTTETPKEFIYWGDLHSHSHYSWDGVGNSPFHYARNVTGLDFYALTDHSVAPPGENVTRGLSAQSWELYNAQTERFNDPPHFVTLHAYECSFGKPFGHHNVYFRGDAGTLVYPSRATLPELWSTLKEGNALTIPHHTGKFPNGVDFSVHNSHFRRNFEIYSGHGLSEAFDPSHPLSFENSTFTSPSRSLDWPSHAQDAWVRGLELSTIASSDDHRAHPGQPHFGLVALRAESLSRNNVFQALYDRHTYATTGAKIILDFSLNDVPMGDMAVVRSEPIFKIFALGTDTIEKVELLKYQKPSKGFTVVKTWNPHSLDFEVSFRDSGFQPNAVYYVRLLQQKRIRDRIVMAWSSPIWTKAVDRP